MELTQGEIKDVLDIKCFPSKRTGYTLVPGIHEKGDINKTLEFLLAATVKLSITNDDIRLKTKLKINHNLIFTEESFFTQFQDLLKHFLII